MTGTDDLRGAVGVAASYLASFASGDPDAVAAHVSADFVNDHRSALGASCQGRDEYRRRLPGFLAAFPGLHYEVLDLVAEGDRVAVAYTLVAAPGGTTVRVPGAMFLTVAHGQISRRVDTFDSLTFLRQTGQAG
jgi:predicted ester cyclase